MEKKIKLQSEDKPIFCSDWKFLFFIVIMAYAVGITGFVFLLWMLFDVTS